MTGVYPVSLDVSRCRVLVVGGGTVAHRKVAGLVEAGGRPELVSPALCEPLRTLVERQGLRYAPRPFAPGDTRGYVLVFAATDRREVNAEVAREAAAAGALVNVVDAPDGGSLRVPATLRRGEVMVSLATGGAAPLFARRLRDRLAETVTPGVGRAAARLAALRRELRSRIPDDEARRRAFWFALLTSDFLDAAIAGRDEEVESRIARCLSQS